MKRFGIILFIFFVLYFIFLIRQDIMDNVQLKQENDVASQHLADEETAAADLQIRLKGLASGRYVEELARTKLGMVKRGETAYKIIR
jgi:cell division protein FtsB